MRVLRGNTIICGRVRPAGTPVDELSEAERAILGDELVLDDSVPLERMRRDDLMAMARAKGVEVMIDATRATLIEALKASEPAPEDETPEAPTTTETSATTEDEAE